MAIFKSIFTPKDKGGGTSLSEQTNKTAADASMGFFQFNAGVLTGTGNHYSKASFEDGVVYYDFPGGKAPIGYYEADGDSTRILCEFDREEIGRLDADGCTRLTRAGLYHRFSKTYYTKFPNPLNCEVGRFYGEKLGFLDEAETHIQLGTFSGDKAGAAAAFICLIYECHSENKYRRFYDRWD